MVKKITKDNFLTSVSTFDISKLLDEDIKALGIIDEDILTESDKERSDEEEE